MRVGGGREGKRKVGEERGKVWRRSQEGGREGGDDEGK